jgi:hypothetical protein
MANTVDLGKRAEAYVYFAIWCRDHKISPWIAAECIELSIRYNRGGVGWDKLVEIRKQIEAKLYSAGVSDIKFEDGWPRFDSAIGERTRLPMKAFI